MALYLMQKQTGRRLSLKSLTVFLLNIASSHHQFKTVLYTDSC